MNSPGDALDNLLIRVMSFNIRYATKSPFPGEQLWRVRCPKVCSQLKFAASGQDSPFICLQEVTYSQLEDIQSQLESTWAHIGKGRDDGQKSGEFSPIFYRQDTWSCVRSETLWLSPTPNMPSKGWDAALNRVVTLGHFRHMKTWTSVIIMCTHLDHQGEEAKKQSAKLLVQLANNWFFQDPENHSSPRPPVFLAGDFNSTPESVAYREVAQGMEDVFDLVPEQERYGNGKITYTSFAGEEPEKTIDYLFTLRPKDVKIKAFGNLSNVFDDKIRLSDHRCIVADVEIPVGPMMLSGG